MKLNIALICTGMVVILAALGYWLMTGTQSLLFVATGIVLIAIGSNEGFRAQMPSVTGARGE